MIRDSRCLLLLTTVLLASCAGPQSAIDPAGPSAASIHKLGMIMYIGASAITLLVIVLMLVPFMRKRERSVNEKLFLWTGVGLPAVTLTVFVPYVLATGHETRAPTSPNHLSIDVTGNTYWWSMSYRRTGGLPGITTANEIRLPVGEAVELLLHSNDVIHSFWVPNIA